MVFCLEPYLLIQILHAVRNIEIMWLQRLQLRIGESFWKEEKDEGINTTQQGIEEEMVFEELVNNILLSSEIGLGNKLLKDLLNNTSLLSETWTTCKIRKVAQQRTFC